jgi:O-antigen/teichoic acid export membrane protein
MSIARLASYNLIGSAVPLAVSLVTVPLYLKIVGLDTYGVLVLCWTLLGYLGFFDLGLGPSVTQRMAALRKSDSAAQARIFWTALWISLAAGAVAGSLLYGLADLYFASIKDPPAGLLHEISEAKGWLAAIIPIMMLTSVLGGAMQGHERFLASNLISSLSTILMSVVPLLVAWTISADLWWLIAASLGARALMLLVQFAICLRTLPVARAVAPDRESLASLLKFGGWITADGLIGQALVTLDRFVIGSMLGAAAVSIYAVPHNLVSYIQLIPAALVKVLFPRFAATAEGEQADALEIASIAALASIMTPVCVALMALVGPFLTLWIGPDLARQSAPVAYFIAFAMCLNGLARVPFSRMMGIGRPDLITKIHLAELPFYLVLMYLGIIHFGVTGAAVAWCIRTVADAAIFLAFAGRRNQALGATVVPFAFVCAGIFVALGLPMDSPLRWLLFGALTLAAAVWSLRTMPELLRTAALKGLDRLR